MTEQETVNAQASLELLRWHLRDYRRSTGLARQYARTYVLLWLGVCRRYRAVQRAERARAERQEARL